MYARQKPLRITTVRVGKTLFTVEVADTALHRMQGLSGRQPLMEREGMLFVFAKPSNQSFWMKGMAFPLDFIWIHQGRVVSITENARPISVTGYRTYSSGSPVELVLEVSAGAVKKFGITVGDAVYYK